MSEAEVAALLLSRYRVRVDPHMTRYAARLLGGPEAFAVVGGDARTGLAVRRMVHPADPGEPSTVTPTS